jgi:hypothetical protein
MIEKKVLKTRKYKAGYEVRTELWAADWAPSENIPTEVMAAYTPSGDFIGDPKMARYLVVKMGIKPEKANDSHCVCSIGFCKERNTWAGWSHRAYCEFGVGHEVKVGDCAFKPSNTKELMESLKSWYSEPEDLYQNVKFDEKEDKIIVHYHICRNDGDIIDTSEEHLIDENTFGRGEWVAETLDDAKQMAIDFASDVS